MDKKSPLQEAFGLFFADLSPGMLIAASVMSLVGICFGLLISSSKRDSASARTPEHFSWKFLLSDNAKRIYKSIATTVLAIFLSLRFADNFIGQKFSMIYAFFLGLCIDAVIVRWKAIKEAISGKISNKKINDDV